MLKTFVCK